MAIDVNWTYCGGHFTVYLNLDHYIVHLQKKTKLNNCCSKERQDSRPKEWALHENFPA